jgi:2-polyprenyl-6-methoxyphenol hydroxylase-like FAD-dependent oxidoreductase
MTNAPLTIIGAGPVGLLLGCLLGKRGVSVTIYEKRMGPPACSMAIGITPPSLDILEQIDLKAD